MIEVRGSKQTHLLVQPEPSKRSRAKSGPTAAAGHLLPLPHRPPPLILGGILLLPPRQMGIHARVPPPTCPVPLCTLHRQGPELPPLRPAAQDKKRGSQSPQRETVYVREGNGGGRG
jgi:hypothetical protein